MRLLIVAGLLALAGISIPLSAQATSARYGLNIPRQPLDGALLNFERQTGFQIARFSDEAGQTVVLGPIEGEFTIDQALTSLLAGTGLTYRLIDDRTIALTKVVPSQSVRSAVARPRAATWVADAAERPLRLAQADATATTEPAVEKREESPAAESDSLAEVVVTATKREESLQQIPLSVTALSSKDLEAKSVVSFADYARSIPAVSFTDLGAGRQRVAIRGIDSKTGTTVVGYYLDETPIADSSSFSAEKATFDPELVDADRIEVLRGPQGTVYGSGSMGGTIRVIPKAPDPSRFESYLSPSVSTTTGTDGPHYRISGMGNFPLIAGRAALRVVGWYQHEDGFIERRVATPASLAANRANGSPLDFQPVGNAPGEKAFGGRAALRFEATERLALEGSIYTESQDFHGFQDITTGALNPSDDRVQNFLFDFRERNRNRLSIANIKADANLGFADLVASASYVKRLLFMNQESAAAMEFVGLAPFFNAAPIREEARDDNASAEVRLSSKAEAGGSASLEWLAGLFYSYQKGWGEVDFRVPGFSQVFQFPVAGDNLFTTRSVNWVEQKAAFGELSYIFAQRLKATAGIRWFDLSRIDSNPQNGLFAGIDDASIPDPYAAHMLQATAQSAVYKGALSWQQNENLMFYAQASEGFRTGFGRPALATPCAADAAQVGASLAEGQVAPDKLWNYEVGAKSDWLAKRLRVNLSGYRIDWTAIQQSIFLPCGFPVLTNLGSVRNYGGELEIEARLSGSVTAGTAVGYVDSALQQDVFGIPGTKDRPIPDIPQVTASAFLSYEFPAFAGWQGVARTDYSYTDGSLSAYSLGGPLTPDKGALSLLAARLSLQKANLEVALFGRNLLNDVERTALERDVSLNVADRLRYSINVPRTFGVSLTVRF